MAAQGYAERNHKRQNHSYASIGKQAVNKIDSWQMVANCVCSPANWSRDPPRSCREQCRLLRSCWPLINRLLGLRSPCALPHACSPCRPCTTTTNWPKSLQRFCRMLGMLQCGSAYKQPSMHMHNLLLYSAFLAHHVSTRTNCTEGAVQKRRHKHEQMVSKKLCWHQSEFLASHLQHLAEALLHQQEMLRLQLWILASPRHQPRDHPTHIPAFFKPIACC